MLLQSERESRMNFNTEELEVREEEVNTYSVKPRREKENRCRGRTKPAGERLDDGVRGKGDERTDGET